MEAAGLALAIPGVIDLCLKYGKELKFLCSALRQADAEVSERVIRLDNGWLRFQHQLHFLQRTHSIMEEEHRDVCAQTLRVLLGKLEIVAAMLRQLVKKEPNGAVTVKKGRYALKKDSLDKAIDEFESWQGIADQSWFLLMRIADTQIDAALKTEDAAATGDKTSTAAAIPSALAVRASTQRSPVAHAASTPGLTFAAEEIAKMTTQPVPYSDTLMGWHNRQRPYLLNHIKCEDPYFYGIIKQDARDLVRRLQHNDPHTFGLLSCKGLGAPSSVPRSGPATFIMIFRMPFPDSTPPKSLRELLLTCPPPKSLSVRFDLARQLARSISYVHTFGFVHKNVRSESILLFSAPGANIMQPGAQHSLFLFGFENFRREQKVSALVTVTVQVGDGDLAKDLYRHPSRQGLFPTDRYTMQHDIYSLGVCLLEIGLWKSLVRYRVDPDWETYFQQAFTERRVNTDDYAGLGKGSTKRYFQGVVKERLAEFMGTRYAEIVETCLTCLDPGNVDFGDEKEFEDEDGIKVGVRYIEKIVMGLNQLYV